MTLKIHILCPKTAWVKLVFSYTSSLCRALDPGSHIEAENYGISVLDHIVLALQTDQSLFPCGSQGAAVRSC